MRIIPSSASPEHWLTLMTCTVCERTPDNSPVYKCGLGHTVCYSCFQQLGNTGIPICSECESDKFTRHDVSEDFLRKLKIKPGIGRPRRYLLGNHHAPPPTERSIEEDVTVEQLFQLPSSKIQQLFDETTKERIRNLHLPSVSRSNIMSKLNLKNEKRDEEVCTVYTLADNSSKIWLKKCNRDTNSIYNFEGNTQSLQSRKPLKCPHDPCNKIIAVSSFQSHFKYDHCDFQRFVLERGKELRLSFNPMIIQHHKTICLGLIKLIDTNLENNSKPISGKAISKEVNTFWVMVSGSPDDRRNHAFAIFWLFTNNDEYHNCTIELSSNKDCVTGTTFCGVNGIHESQNIAEITQRLNCLFLTYGTIKSMLAYGPLLKLRVVIH